MANYWTWDEKKKPKKAKPKKHGNVASKKTPEKKYDDPSRKYPSGMKMGRMHRGKK